MLKRDGHLFVTGGRMTEVGLSVTNHAGRLLKPLFNNGPSWEVAQVLHSVVEELRCEAVFEADEEMKDEDAEDHA